MREIRQERDMWRWPAVGLWVVFFWVGLVPERVFLRLRDLAEISTYDAALNSYQLITLALTTYLAFFCYRRCREAGLTDAVGQGKAIQVGTLGLLAFLDVPFEQLVETRSPYYYFLLGIASAKMVAWLYLLSIIVRYYFWRRNQVFSRMITLIPSAHALDSSGSEQMGPEGVEGPPGGLQEGAAVNQLETDLVCSDDGSSADTPSVVEQEEAM